MRRGSIAGSGGGSIRFRRPSLSSASGGRQLPLERPKPLASAVKSLGRCARELFTCFVSFVSGTSATSSSTCDAGRCQALLYVLFFLCFPKSDTTSRSTCNSARSVISGCGGIKCFVAFCAASGGRQLAVKSLGRYARELFTSFVSYVSRTSATSSLTCDAGR